VRPSPGSRPFPARILDVKLLPKKDDLGVGLLELGAEPTTTGGPAAGVRENNAGQGDRVQDAGLDVLRPLPGQADRWASRHDELLVDVAGTRIVTL